MNIWHKLHGGMYGQLKKKYKRTCCQARNIDTRIPSVIAGLAPMTRQSGQWGGKVFIQGGRKHLPDALYMPAVVTDGIIQI